MLDIRGPAPAAHLCLSGCMCGRAPPPSAALLRLNCVGAPAPLQTLYGRTAAFLKKGVDPLRLLARATYAPAEPKLLCGPTACLAEED